MSNTSKLLQVVFIGVVAGALACGTPRVNGVAGASPAPNVPWTPPVGAVKPEPLVTPSQINAVPPDLQQRIEQLT
ncbi:MAG TPA: hypothetical protein VEM14_10415, partial [Gemmatimonadaceae bacterium]|nr:hypothetical protein [Gemmatimonadaceae bacterium]